MLDFIIIVVVLAIVSMPFIWIGEKICSNEKVLLSLAGLLFVATIVFFFVTIYPIIP